VSGGPACAHDAARPSCPSVPPVVGRSACTGAAELEDTNCIGFGQFPRCLWFELAEKLALCDIRTIRANPARVSFEDPDGTLHQFSTDSCCNVRKVEPLERALAPFDGWITGRKRFQNTDRGTIDFFENEGDFRIKVNPLAHWGREDLEEYMVENRLPRHPLVAKGFPSIGCAPCTSPVKPGEDPRAGRWRGQSKTECGIHFIDGKAVRTPKETAA